MANDWSYYLIDTIHAANVRAVMEIKRIVFAQDATDGHEKGKNKAAEDHFPVWQQDIVRRRVRNAAERAYGVIQAARKAKREAGERLHDAFMAAEGLEEWEWCGSQGSEAVNGE